VSLVFDQRGIHGLAIVFFGFVFFLTRFFFWCYILFFVFNSSVFRVSFIILCNDWLGK